MSFRTLLSIGVFGTVLALSSTAQAITVNPAGEKFKFGWNDGSGDIDGICSGTCSFPDLIAGNQKVWTISVATKSVLGFLKVVDGFVPGDTFSLKINGAATDWTSTTTVTKPHEGTSTLTSGYFEGTLTNFVLQANVLYTFALSVAVTNTCTRDGQVLTPCTVGAAFAEFGALSELPLDVPPPPPPPDEPTAVPVPGALPLLATGLGILGFGAWRRRR